MWYGFAALKRKLLIGLVAVTGLVALWISSQKRADQHITYQGKSVRTWALELYANFDLRTTNAASSAFQAMGSNAVPALRELLNTPDSFFEKPLMQNARSIPAAPRRYLFEKLKPGKAAITRTSAARALTVLGPAAQDAVPDLIAALEDPSVEVRWAAAQALGRIGPRAILALMVAATNQNATLRHIAVYALGETGTNAAPAAAVLFARTLDTNGAVRASAMYSLARVGPAAVPIVLEEFSANDSARQAAAARAIRAMNTPPRQIMRTLLELSTNASPALRQQSIQALDTLQLNSPFAIVACVRALNDGDPGVRRAAVLALAATPTWTTNEGFGQLTMRLLGQTGTLSNHVVTTLGALREDAAPAVRSAAQQALEQIQASNPD